MEWLSSLKFNSSNVSDKIVTSEASFEFENPPWFSIWYSSVALKSFSSFAAETLPPESLSVSSWPRPLTSRTPRRKRASNAYLLYLPLSLPVGKDRETLRLAHRARFALFSESSDTTSAKVFQFPLYGTQANRTRKLLVWMLEIEIVMVVAIDSLVVRNSSHRSLAPYSSGSKVNG